MSATIRCKLLLATQKDHDASRIALDKIGFGYLLRPKDTNRTVLVVEVRTEPAIIADLDRVGYTLYGGASEYSINGITDLGINIFIVDDAGAGVVFIPFTNIVGIHDLSESLIAEIEENSEKRCQASLKAD